MQTRRVGIGLGFGLVGIGSLLWWGALQQGDPTSAYMIGAPTAAIAVVGTLAYAFLPRRRVAIRDGVLHVGNTPWPNARISPIGLLGDGFSTTRAFQLLYDDGAEPIWITKWSFPNLDAMHARLSALLPEADLPPERPNPFLRRWHAKQAELAREEEEKKAARGPKRP